MFISAVKKWASDGLSSQPFGDWYETVDGRPQGFRARPVVGGHCKHLSSSVICISLMASFSGVRKSSRSN